MRNSVVVILEVPFGLAVFHTRGGNAIIGTGSAAFSHGGDGQFVQHLANGVSCGEHRTGAASVTNGAVTNLLEDHWLIFKVG